MMEAQQQLFDPGCTIRMTLRKYTFDTGQTWWFVEVFANEESIAWNPYSNEADARARMDRVKALVGP